MSRPLVRSIDYTALESGRHELLFELADRPGGSPLSIPVSVLVGRQSRPRLAAIAGVHGNEFHGPLALSRLIQSLDPAELNGIVVLVPVANPLAFDAGVRSSPEDGVNMNRVFPGSPDGTLTHRLAWALVDGIVQDPDLVMDLHSATAEGDMLPMAGYRAPPPNADSRALEVTRASARAAAACAFEMFWQCAWAPGTLSTALNQRGIVALGFEVGGGGRARAAEIDLYEQAVRRCMRLLGIHGERLDVDMPKQAWTMEDVPSPASGVLDLAVGLRDEVRAGQPLGAVFDLFGRAVAEPVAPFAGRVVHVRTFRQVRAGDTLLSLSRPVSTP